MKEFKKLATDMIDRYDEVLKSPNIETNKAPDFVVSIRQGNDRELLNLYIDYKTSRQWINRMIFTIGKFDDYTEHEICKMQSFTIELLKSKGYSAR